MKSSNYYINRKIICIASKRDFFHSCLSLEFCSIVVAITFCAFHLSVLAALRLSLGYHQQIKPCKSEHRGAFKVMESISQMGKSMAKERKWAVQP